MIVNFLIKILGTLLISIRFLAFLEIKLKSKPNRIILVENTSKTSSVTTCSSSSIGSFKI